MTRRWLILGATALSLSAASLTGCTQATGETDDYVQTEQGILGGQLADDTYSAVGAIVLESPAPFSSTSVICSGTLVGPSKVLTARHCTQEIARREAQGSKAYFNIGLLAYDPDQSIRITGFTQAPSSPTHPGLLFDGGRDMAVANLNRAPHGVTPVRLGEFTSDLLGEQFTIAGFGRDDNNFAGLRYAGPATARSLGGAWYPLLFDNKYGPYLNWYFDDAVTSNPSAREAKAWWEVFTLEPGFELLAGGLEGEALGCFGDSGGPLLLGDSADNLTAYAVSFASEASQSEICTRGGAYVVNNNVMLGFIDGAL